MDDLISRALDRATLKGAQYVDVRVAQTTEQMFAVKNGLVDAVEHNESTGFGVRVSNANNMLDNISTVPEPSTTRPMISGRSRSRPISPVTIP